MCLVFLCSCATKEKVVQSETLIHPTWPTPINPYTFNWKVIPVDDKVYVGLEYAESLEFRIFLEDVKRYVKESNSMICFYREDLKEKRCFFLKTVDTEKEGD